MSRFHPAVVAAALFVLMTSPLAQIGPQLNANEIRAAIEERLRVAPRGFDTLTPPVQAGVTVRSVTVDPMGNHVQRVTIDLNQRALTYDPSGSTELLLDEVLRAVARLTSGSIEFRFLIDGLPLEQFVSRAASPRVRALDVSGRGPVLISAGHGWYWNESGRQWLLQRDHWWGIVEDFVNWDIAAHVLEELRVAGIDARPARHPDALSGGGGASGQPLWQESAKYFIRSIGAPADVSDFGANEYNRDINSRPFYANWINASAIVSIHNNGGWGSGTETWYDATHPWAEESRRLAQIVQDAVVRAIRQHYDPAWPDRGLRTCNGCKGETRLATRPAIILEVAFMDTQWPDNAALHDDRFKRIVAQAVREALQTWSATTVIDD